MADSLDHGTTKILVVGAGPAGLAAAIAAGKTFGAGVRVLEGADRPGRKFLLSGSGQCNLTHGGPIDDFPLRYGGVKQARFVLPALLTFDNHAAIRYFEERGVEMLEREDGKVFPECLKSRVLLEVLTEDLLETGARLRCAAPVTEIERNERGFLVRTGEDVIRTEILILAAGGCSYPKTGSRGDGYGWAERLGHRIVPPRPALTPVIVRDYPFSSSAGVSFRQTPVELFRRGKRIHRKRGDVLLTHRGLSGPGILDLSRWMEPGDTIRVTFCPAAGNWPDLLVGKKTLKNALVPLGIPERFLVQLLEQLEIDPDRSASEVGRNERKRLAAALEGYPLIIDRLGGWDEAMVTAGGIALDRVDRQTMQSRLVPGLFFCGEILDVDGDTGGYNIQFALSSGFLAGNSAIALRGKS